MTAAAIAWTSPAPEPDRLALSQRVLFTILAAQAVAIFVVRLPQTLKFDDFAFFDTGSNLTVQYLISHGYRPVLDFGYPYGLLPLIFGRVWFAICGFTPLACGAVPPFLDIFIIWGFVRFAANLKLNLAGIAIILLTATLTVPSGLLNFTHGIETVLLIHALADQAGGNRRRALALAAITLFVKPSMAYFLGFVLIAFICFDCWRNRPQPLRAFAAEISPAALSGLTVGGILAAIFGAKPVALTVMAAQGRSMYHARGYGFFNGAGRLFLTPHGAPWAFYLVNKTGPWIIYTVALVIAGTFAARRLYRDLDPAPRADRTSEVILTCAVLHLSFVLFFFGNESSWTYYFYMLVLGLAAAARLGMRWKLAVACLAFAIPMIKVDKAILPHLAPASLPTSSAEGAPAPTMSAPTAPMETGFGYRLWFTTSRSPETAGLWTTPGERAEWIRVLATIRGHRAAMLDYFGCASLLFPEFGPPVTFSLVPGEYIPAALSRVLSQLEAASMIVMPRWQSRLLDDVPEIGALVRHDFDPVFQGRWFIVYSRRSG